MKSRQPKQASQYDKILKENLEAAIPALIKKVLGIETIATEEIPDDIQHTKERKPDALKRITDQAGRTFILQLEFQVADEPKMVYRMLNYCAMLLERYEIPIRQYVFYLGPTAPTMTTDLNIGDLSFRYTLIPFQQLDYRLFLSSDVPEEILLAVLANFQPQDSSTVLNQILHRLDETANGPLVFQRYIAQLRVLVQLRKLRPILDTAMDTIAKYIDEQNDVFFIKGKQEGEQKGKQEGEQKGEQKGKVEKEKLFVENLIRQTDFEDNQIASLASVSMSFVQSIRQRLAKS